MEMSSDYIAVPKESSFPYDLNHLQMKRSFSAMTVNGKPPLKPVASKLLPKSVNQYLTGFIVVPAPGTASSRSVKIDPRSCPRKDHSAFWNGAV